MAPSRRIRRGRGKSSVTPGWARLLVDLRENPREGVGRAGERSVAGIELERRERLVADWAWNTMGTRVRVSPWRRLFRPEPAANALALPPWSDEARHGDAQPCVRPAPVTGTVGTKPRARFPFAPPTLPDRARS